MTTNHRTPCYYCKNPVLSRDYGRHLLSKHEDRLFDKDSSDGKTNLRSLWVEKYERTPLGLYINNDPLYFCLSDSSAIKRLNLAEPKVKKNKEAHRQAVLALRDKYPNPKGVEKEPVGGGLSPTQIDAIQQVVWELVDHIRCAEKQEGDSRWSWEHTCKKALSLIPFSLAEKELNAKFEDPEEEEEPEKEEVKEQEEEEWPPITEPPKPKVSPILGMVKDVMTDSSVPLNERQDYVRHAIAQHRLSDPELEMFLTKSPDPESTLYGSKKRPLPRAPPPTPPVSEKPKPLPPAFNPHSYLSVPEQPKYPSIIGSTKRSTQ